MIPPPATPQTQPPKETPAATPPPATETPEPSTGGSRPILPLIVAGTGLVMFVTGGIVWLGAQSDIKDFEKKCPGRQCPDKDPVTGESLTPDEQNALTEEGNSIITRRDVSGVIALVGVGAMAGGVVWYFLSKPSANTNDKAKVPPRGFTAHVRPALAPGYGGLSFSGAF